MVYPFTSPNNRIVQLTVALYLILFFTIPFSGTVYGESDKDFAQQFRRQGLQAQQSGEYGKALLFYSRAASYAPDDAAIQNDLGLMYEQLGKLDDAEESYRAAIEKDTRFVPAYANLGILLKKRGRYELAAMYLQRRIELGGASDPWMLTAQEELEDLYRKAPYLKNSRTLDSASEMERQIAQDKTLARETHKRRKTVNYELAMRKGLEAFRSRDYKTAVSLFEEAVRYRPDSAEAQHALDRAKGQARQAEIASSLKASAGENRSTFVDRDLNTVEGVPEAPEDDEQ